VEVNLRREEGWRMKEGKRVFVRKIDVCRMRQEREKIPSLVNIKAEGKIRVDKRRFRSGEI
jgi:hypothetical protein